ncbi:SWI/SNF complex subunit SWI3D [Quillaja saponaria]|uniref:SWI/SNF complex subunit SWI3D n=1 Tax=Quillaja saponaria TaxID=32244 RepID=A0AAD7M0C3_QUISA|nr:SWI/SNF complex subunit SWI3D [Quillaja saponaria]KAJ7967337.1 SWI/SNF complex subunit SWI3D [Quillaja saponaria]
MEEKRRDVGALPPAITESPVSEPASSRRRAQKRKNNSLNLLSSSSTPSKRITRESASFAHPPIHIGSLTRARQIPNNFAAVASELSAGVAASSADTVVKQTAQAVPIQALGGSFTLAEELNKQRKRKALEAGIEAEFEAIRSRSTNVHVVPSHCGWFSWTTIHPIEERTLPSFFAGKTENRTLDVYMEIRNWIMKKFHAKPDAQIELKDLSELDVGELDARQEVMEFLDHWGLINFHPFPSTDTVVASADDDGEAEKKSLGQSLYHFDTMQFCSPVIPKTNLMSPALPSRLFPDSAIAEAFLRQEGPVVEYHCNSCSTDCSRKRYHCQKQADFDLCTDCFNNGKFGSGMSVLDFILMEPAEVPGVSGGKWTDQETLLLLEALELYKENWNEIAEHVATKTKAQCILHFVQMPIQDTFLDCDDDIDANSKGTSDPSTTKNDSSVPENASEMMESKTADGEGQALARSNGTSKAEDFSEVKVREGTPKSEDICEEKISDETCKIKSTSDVKLIQKTGEDCAIKALSEAFEAVGYVPGAEGPLSFAEVGNPVMALAVFLARLVGSDVAIASAHSSLKSISGNSPAMQLAARHCFVLEDPPDDDKEPSNSERDSLKDRKPDDRNEKQDKSVDEGALSKKFNGKKNETIASEEKGLLVSLSEESSEKPVAVKEKEVTVNHGEIVLGNCNDTSDMESAKDQPPSTLQEPNDLTSKVELLPISAESGEGNFAKETSAPTEETKDVHAVSNSLSSERNEPKQSAISNSEGERPMPSGAPTDVEMVFHSQSSEKTKPQIRLMPNPVEDPLERSESLMDVETVPDSLPSDKNEIQPLVTSEPSQCSTEGGKDVGMESGSLPMEKNGSLQPVTSNAGAVNGASTGENHTENGKEVKHICKGTNDDHKLTKVKHAAVCAIAAASVKAKLLANQQEDQIQHLATMLIEKQLHKLETKLAFFNEMENVVMRVREHLDRSRQKLYHERVQIIASRLGSPASSSKVVPPSLPTNRIPMNFANSVPRGPRPPMSMILERPPPASRPMGTVGAIPSNSLASSTTAGNAIRQSM